MHFRKLYPVHRLQGLVPVFSLSVKFSVNLADVLNSLRIRILTVSYFYQRENCLLLFVDSLVDFRLGKESLTF